MRASWYMERHNYVLKSVHMAICSKYRVTNNKKLRKHAVQDTIVARNGKIEIRVDKSVPTEIKVEAYRPDLVVIDHEERAITIIEVGITCQDRLKYVEEQKKTKYDTLLNEMKSIYGYSGRAYSLVMTWDGVVTTYLRGVCKMLGLSDRARGYIQYVALSKTQEAVFRSFGEQTEEDGEDVEV